MCEVFSFLSFSIGAVTLPWLQVTDSTHNMNCVRLKLDSSMAATTAAHSPEPTNKDQTFKDDSIDRLNTFFDDNSKLAT
jgi:hypothetical protein